MLHCGCLGQYRWYEYEAGQSFCNAFILCAIDISVFYNNEAWCELGVAFYKRNDITKAEDALQQANAIKPLARAYLYLGLINESRQDFRNHWPGFSEPTA